MTLAGPLHVLESVFITNLYHIFLITYKEKDGGSGSVNGHLPELSIGPTQEGPTVRSRYSHTLQVRKKKAMQWQSGVRESSTQTIDNDWLGLGWDEWKKPKQE